MWFLLSQRRTSPVTLGWTTGKEDIRIASKLCQVAKENKQVNKQSQKRKLFMISVGV